MEMVKGTKCAGKVHQTSSRHVPGMQNSSAQSGRGKQQLLGAGRTTPRLGLKPIPVHTPDGCVDRGCRKDVPGQMMFADDIAICGDGETDMTEYLETWRRALEDRGMRISRPKTQFIEF